MRHLRIRRTTTIQNGKNIHAEVCMENYVESY